MICLRTRYFRLNRFLLLILGLWPYEQSKITRLQLIVLQSILLSFVLFQFTSLLTSNYTPQLTIEVLSNAFPVLSYVIKYNMFGLNINYVKHLLELIQYTYDELKDESEVAILEAYGNTGRRYTTILTLFGVTGILSFMSYPLLPIILNIISANKSESDVAAVRNIGYVVNREEYLHLILLHANAAYCIGGIIAIAIGTMNVTYFHLVCGMFKISSYRVQQAMMIYTLEISSTRNQRSVQKEISYGVDMHCKAMWTINVFTSKLETFFFLLITVGITSSSFNLFQIFQVLSSGRNLEKAAFPFVGLCVFYTYVIIACNITQQITDHNENIFDVVYNVKWYKAPLNIQKMILFILQKGSKPFCINFGGIFIASLENSAKLLSASMSHFMILYSAQQE